MVTNRIVKHILQVKQVLVTIQNRILP